MFYPEEKYKMLADFQKEFSRLLIEMEQTLTLPLRNLNEQTWAGERPNYLESEFEKELAWKTFTHKFFSISHLPNRKACPVLSSLLDKYPNIVTAEYSMLEPKTHILPHRGYTGKVLRAHLGMIVPKGDLGISVGGVTKSWKENSWIVFDDSIEHEAWNQSDERRVVLMIDFIPEGSNVSIQELCKEVVLSTNDSHILNIAPRESWIEWLNQGFFPVL